MERKGFHELWFLHLAFNQTENFPSPKRPRILLRSPSSLREKGFMKLWCFTTTKSEPYRQGSKSGDIHFDDDEDWTVGSERGTDVIQVAIMIVIMMMLINDV